MEGLNDSLQMGEDDRAHTHGGKPRLYGEGFVTQNSYSI